MIGRGTRGEKSFSLLCSNAGLICNRSEEDMAGWDFYVQFPLDKNFLGSTDHRPSAISAFFQVKTSKDIIENICIKLSNAERMARELKPTFFAFGLDRGEIKDIKFEVAHLGEDAISHILSTLRKNDALPFSRRKKTICLNRSILEIDDAGTPTKLREAIVKRSSVNVEDYVRNKIFLTKTVGYSKNSFESNFSVQGSGADDKLISLMIGEIDELEVQDFSVTETRFGIPRLLQNSPSGILKMEPSKKEFGLVEFLSNDSRFRAEFECEMRAPQAPWVDEDQFRIRISNDIFSFVFGPTVGFSNWRSDVDTKVHFHWDKLKNLLHFMHICTLGTSRMNVYIEGRKAIEAEFTSSVKSNWLSDDLIATISAVDFMQSYPGLRAYLTLSGNEFIKLMNNRSMLFALLKNVKSNDLRIGCTLSDNHKGNPTDTTFVFPFGFSCGGKLVAMLLLAKGLGGIEGREVQMPIRQIQLEAFGVYSDRKSALSSLKISAKTFCDRAPEEGMIVVEPSIYTEIKYNT